HVGTIRGAELEPEVLRKADILAVHDRSPASLSLAKGVELPATRYSVAGAPDLNAVPTLADLISGVAQGRTSPEQSSCFLNLVGIGLQFAALGALFYRKATAARRGRELPTEWLTQDVVP